MSEAAANNAEALEHPCVAEQKISHPASGARILVAEDDPDLREALADTLELAGFSVTQVCCAEDALDYLQGHFVDMLVSDVSMGSMDGHQLLAAVQRGYPQIPVLLITAYGSISRSVEAIRGGAVDYLVKPFKPQILVETVRRHVNPQQAGAFGEPVAEEPSSKQMLQLAKRVAQADSTVLICGESGTGKEVLASYIHRHSSRSKQAFVAINCAAIPENMLESTLFGHEKGAFTGAYSSAPGKFELANGGTLLLDEISEMSVGLQAKLLRVLQEREVERLGGRKTINLDVRVIATTNRDLQEEVRAGRFREDLYYRLSVFPLHWLPLRERRADIIPIARRLIDDHVQRMNHVKVHFDDSAEQALLEYDWPGNVRELDNVVQRALILQSGSVISDVHLRLDPYANPHHIGEELSEAKPGFAGMPHETLLESEGALGSDLKVREFEIIIETLKKERGSRKSAAEKLGISPRTLRYKLARMRESGIDVELALA